MTAAILILTALLLIVGIVASQARKSRRATVVPQQQAEQAEDALADRRRCLLRKPIDRPALCDHVIERLPDGCSPAEQVVRHTLDWLERFPMS